MRLLLDTLWRTPQFMLVGITGALFIHVRHQANEIAHCLSRRACSESVVKSWVGATGSHR